MPSENAGDERARAESEPDRTKNRGGRRLVLASVAGLGAAAVMTQLVLVRELLTAFSGNELVLGVGLGAWLLLTGAGTWLGPWAGCVRRPCLWMAALQAGVAVVPLVQVVAVRVLRDVVFLPGSAVGVGATAAATLAILLPFCVLSGVQLILACGALEKTEADPARGIGRVYVADVCGSIAGGVLFSFVLVSRLDHFALLTIPALLNLALAIRLAARERAWVAAAFPALLAIGVAGFVVAGDVDGRTTAMQHGGRNVLWRASSPYGRLVVTGEAGQVTFFENGVPAIASHDIGAVEESVHYAMSQRPGARRVLLIGGGVGGAAREILRHGVEEVVYVELDPATIEAGRRFLPQNLDDPRIRTLATDGRRVVRESRGEFDVVIVDLPDPSTAQLNRFYTVEFLMEVKRALVPGGVVGFAAGRYENYVSPELAAILGSAWRTAGRVFANVRMIPGGRVYFVASDGPVDLAIAERLEARGLRLQLVTRHYLDTMLAPDRVADLERAVERPAPLNRDFNPVLYWLQLRRWLSQFRTDGAWLPIGVGLALVAYFMLLRPVPRVLFAAGFASSALEVVLLLAFQVLYGSVYRQVGVVVTVFMAGMAGGAWWSNRRRAGSGPSATGAADDDGARASRRLLVGLGLAVAGLAAALPWLLPRLGALDAALASALPGQAAILACTFALAALAGGQFPLAAALQRGAAAGSAGRLFSADLLGASFGALLVSTVLVPLFGLAAVCLLTAALNLAAAALAWRWKPAA